MDSIDLAKLGISVVSTLYSRKKVSLLISQIDSALVKIDELFLREFRAAFQAVEDVLITNSEETKTIRLRFIEDNLLKYIGINPLQNYAEFTGAKLLAFTHYGLSFVCYIRGDYSVTLKHILSCFKYEPELCRDKLLPEFYRLHLASKVQQMAKDWTEKNEKIILNERFLMGTILRRSAVATGYVGMMGIALGAYIGLGPGGGYGVTKSLEEWQKGLDKFWDESDSNSLKEKAIKLIRKEAFSSLKQDEFCRQIATDMLNKLSTESISNILK